MDAETLGLTEVEPGSYLLVESLDRLSRQHPFDAFGIFSQIVKAGVNIVTLVAEEDGNVLGVCDMEYHQRLGDHRPQARVNDLVVTEAARGKRIANAMEAARSIAKRGLDDDERASRLHAIEEPRQHGDLLRLVGVDFTERLLPPG